MLSSPHLLRALSVEQVDEITILPFTGAIVLWRARLDSATSRTAPASFAHIHRSLLCLSPLLLVRNVSLLFLFYPTLWPFYPYLVYLPKPPSTLTTDSFDCPELTSTTFPGSEDSTFRISVTIRSHWSPTALAVPITLCDCRDRPYAPITSSVASEATGCGTSMLMRGLRKLFCRAEKKCLKITGERKF